MDNESFLIALQMKLQKEIEFKNLDISTIKNIAGIDIAYCTVNEIEYGCCSIVVIDF